MNPKAARMIRRQRTEAEDFQMAPMIDMVFLLLVFFMCVSTLAQLDRSVAVDLPEADSSLVPDDLSDRGLFTLSADGVLFLGQEPISLASFSNIVRDELGRTPDLKIQLRADRQVPFSEIRRVLQAAAEEGAHQIIYATYQSN